MPRIIDTKTPDQQALERDGLAALAASDVVRATALGHVERMEAAKATSLARERLRLIVVAGEASEEVKRHDRKIAAHAAELAATRAELQRARTPPLKVAADRSVLHGRVVDAARAGIAGLTVVAGGRERPLGRSDTDANGYFRIELPAAARSADPERVVLGRGTTPTVTLSVLRGDKEVYRGEEVFALEPRIAEYRELELR